MGDAARPARQHAVHRPAPEDELRARPPQRPVDLLPRRADARPGRRRRAPGPRAGPRLEGGGARPDGPAHDPLHGRGGRAVRPHRHRRPRPHPGHRHPDGAEEAGPARIDLPPRARSARRRPGDARAAARRRERGTRRGRPADGTADRQTRRRSTWPSSTTRRSAASSGRSAGSAPQILALRKSEPSLEDVFVELVGRGFDDEGERRARRPTSAGAGRAGERRPNVTDTTDDAHERDAEVLG